MPAPPPLPLAHANGCKCLDCWSECWLARAQDGLADDDWKPPPRPSRLWRLTLLCCVTFTMGWMAVSHLLSAQEKRWPPATVAPATVSVTLPQSATAPFELPPPDIAALEPIGAIVPPHHSHHHHHHHHHHARTSGRHALTQLVSASDWVDPFSQ